MNPCEPCNPLTSYALEQDEWEEPSGRPIHVVGRGALDLIILLVDYYCVHHQSYTVVIVDA